LGMPCADAKKRGREAAVSRRGTTISALKNGRTGNEEGAAGG
jgi:hypothetical protein